MFRVAAVYAVVAWLTVQVASVTFPHLSLPPWTITLVIVLAATGFPLALTLAWVFDVTSEGVVRTPKSSPGGEPDGGRATASGPAAGEGGRKRAVRSDRLDSIAVLPFKNFSPDPENEYFSDGVTEEIINALVRVDGLHVVARTSVFAYKNRSGDVRQIGRELGVATILEGSVRKAENRLRITAQLVATADGYHLWSETYDRELEDVFAIQEEIARSIMETLTPQLAKARDRPLVRRYTEDLEAFQLYLKGRHAWSKRVEEGLRTAVDFFERAIARDPDYARAHAGLADTYALLGIAEYGFMDPRVVMPKAREAALRALDIDGELAEAQTSLAHIAAFFDWDPESAEQGFRRAIELDPGYAFAYHWYACLLSALGRHEEAVEAERKAQKLEPFSAIINKNVGTVLFYAGRQKEALEEYQRALELEPHYPRTLFYLALAHDLRSEFEEAVGWLESALAQDQSSTVMLAALGYTYALAGRRPEAEEVLTDLERRRTKRYVPAFNLALIHVGLGDLDPAMEWLEQAFEERSSWLLSLRVEPMLEPLREDLRFRKLAERVAGSGAG